MSETLKIITRSSVLAMWQAEHVALQLKEIGLSTEIIPIETKGDKVLNTSISKIGSKGVFTEELENALLEGRADLAVHSAKDMPSSLPDNLELIAFGKREKVNDVLVSHHQGLDSDKGFRIGTSSTRRVGLVKHYFPNCKVVPMRGNLQTRFQKMENGDCEALLLAFAGVHRLGMEQYIIKELNPNTFTPQAGQGAITIEVAKNLDAEKKKLIVQACNDTDSQCCVEAERSFLKASNGGCSVPIFVHSTLNGDNIYMKGGLISLNGSELIEAELIGPKKNGLQLGQDLAKDIFQSKNGNALLKSIKEELGINE